MEIADGVSTGASYVIAVKSGDGRVLGFVGRCVEALEVATDIHFAEVWPKKHVQEPVDALNRSFQERAGLTFEARKVLMVIT